MLLGLAQEVPQASDAGSGVGYKCTVGMVSFLTG